jgi:hypothetical protein
MNKFEQSDKYDFEKILIMKDYKIVMGDNDRFMVFSCQNALIIYKKEENSWVLKHNIEFLADI